ncbi:FAD-dependent oxidoreductase [Streptomyces venezuelae]|uniref:FAD-dependent oxidoreductase n=1 Tax=Streptomyces venezuelae TaxID=54571 RepID=UPI001239C01F|nr:FAD-dependent oxidoreductase [Streptomyces venezuelae]QES09775.1 FAD-dependent oxidoreductase [Streptomyces venezuelae]
MTTHIERDVAVIGNGLMGSSIVRALARSGWTVTAYDPDTARARALATELPGVEAESDLETAVASARLILTCAPSHEAVLRSLECVGDWTRKTLLNTGTSSTDESKKAGSWAAEKGVPYLDAAILCFPQDIGTERGYVLFSGSPEAWADHEKLLAALGPAMRFVSEQVQAASAVDLTIVGGVYVAALAACIDAAAYAHSQGVSGDVLDEATDRVLAALKDGAKEAVAAIGSGDFTTDQAALSVFTHGGETCLDGMRGAGFAANVLEAAVRNLKTAEAAGLGGSSFYALAQVAGGDSAAGRQQ